MGVPGPAFAGVDDAFLKSVFEGERKETESLLQLGADIEARTNKGSTALIVAAAGGHTEIIQLFLERGASTKPVTKNGWTALKVALQLGRLEVVQQLKLAGAKE